MRKHGLVILLIIIAVRLLAAQTNYVLTYTARQPIDSILDWDAPLPSYIVKDANYTDALGRPLFAVSYGAAGTGDDIVTHTEYDPAGLPAKQWLAVPMDARSGELSLEQYKNALSDFYPYEDYLYSLTTYKHDGRGIKESQSGPGNV